MRRHITLTGEKAEAFDRVKEDLAEMRGAEPSNTEVVMRLCEEWPAHQEVAGDAGAQDRRRRSVE